MWYFKTFCGIDKESFVSRQLDALDASTNIKPYLKGTVKPYDLCALILALPGALDWARLTPTEEPAPDAL